ASNRGRVSPRTASRSIARAFTPKRPIIGSPVAASLALSWSGGKDSALTLWTLEREARRRPSALITTVTDVYDRVSMHGVRRSLLESQAASLRLPLVEVPIPPACTNDVY